MFISKAEKETLHLMIQQLQSQLRDENLRFTDQISALMTDMTNVRMDIRRLQVSKIVEVVNSEKTKRTDNIEHIKHERKKASMREYYHRKRAEKLAAEKKSAQQGLIDVKDGVPVTPPHEASA